MSKKRVAYARIMQETNALWRVQTTLSDFEQSHYLEGQALLQACSPGGHEVEGFFRKAEIAGFLDAAREQRADVEPVPLFSAWASSGGPLSQACFETLEGRLVEGLRKAGRVDGVFLALHGAMGVVGVRDPETRLLRAARDAAGGAPVVTTHDLHANLTQGRVDAAHAIAAYQTNPHRDHARIGKKAGRILLGSLRGELRPTTAWRSLPMLLGGGNTVDFLAPMRSLFLKMRWEERKKNLLAVSTFMVHPWNDDPALGWSTHVVTNGDAALAEALADELAEMCWERRHELPPTFSTPEEALRQAHEARWQRKLGVVMLADASDVVTAGAAGDSTHLLRAILEHGAPLVTYAAVRDPDAIQELWTVPLGKTVTTSVGGKLDPASSSPLPITAVVLSKHEIRGFLRMVVLSVGHLRLVVTEGPAMVMRPSFYQDVGLDILRADVVVVKNFFPFLLFFAPYSRKTIFVKTRGTTDFDAAFKLKFDGPMTPRDPVDDWRARDALRRGKN